MLISLIVPAFNESGNIKPFVDATIQAFEPSEFDFEIVFIDDGSKDATIEQIKDCCEKGNIKISAIEFSRNFGKEAALFAGLETARGEVCVFIDADLQQPPAIALDMIRTLMANPDIDCVAAYQEQRKQNPLVNKLSQWFYRLLEGSSQLNVVYDASDFRAFRSNVKEALLTVNDYYRFSKGIFAWIGFKTLPYPYVPEDRLTGETKWSLIKLAKYAINGLLSFTTVPLKVATWLGTVLCVASIIYALIVFIERLTVGIEVPGYTTIVILILLLGGLTMLMLGVIGEYLARVYIEGKQRPIYLVRKTYQSHNYPN